MLTSWRQESEKELVVVKGIGKKKKKVTYLCIIKHTSFFTESWNARAESTISTFSSRKQGLEKICPKQQGLAKVRIRAHLSRLCPYHSTKMTRFTNKSQKGKRPCFVFQQKWTTVYRHWEAMMDIINQAQWDRQAGLRFHTGVSKIVVEYSKRGHVCE